MSRFDWKAKEYKSKSTIYIKKSAIAKFEPRLLHQLAYGAKQIVTGLLQRQFSHTASRKLTTCSPNSWFFISITFKLTKLSYSTLTNIQSFPRACSGSMKMWACCQVGQVVEWRVVRGRIVTAPTLFLSLVVDGNLFCLQTSHLFSTLREKTSTRTPAPIFHKLIEDGFFCLLRTIAVLGGGCSTEVEHTTREQEIVGSNPAWRWAFFLQSFPTFLHQWSVPN